MTPRPQLRDERGTISIFILGLAAIAMTLVAGGVAVTSAHLSRMALLDAADGAALAAANALDESGYRDGIDGAVPISDASVRAEAAAYLSGLERPARVSGWALGPGTGTPDGQTAVVVLTGSVDLPLVGGVLRRLGTSISISVTSSARADVIQP